MATLHILCSCLSNVPFRFKRLYRAVRIITETTHASHPAPSEWPLPRIDPPKTRVHKQTSMMSDWQEFLKLLFEHLVVRKK